MDPLFVSPENNDFSYHENSPCIDNGDPTQYDIDLTRRDIGAYFEEIQQIDGDCNLDNTLNVLDILFIINNCILTIDEINNNCDCSDINNDDFINVLDVVTIVQLILNNSN